MWDAEPIFSRLNFQACHLPRVCDQASNIVAKYVILGSIHNIIHNTAKFQYNECLIDLAVLFIIQPNLSFPT